MISSTAAIARWSIVRPILIPLILLSGLLVVAGSRPHPSFAASTTVIIAEVYGGGGNTNAPYKNDFVELYNLSTSTSVNLSTYSIQYQAQSGTGWTVISLVGSIAPLGHYLIQLGSGGSTGSSLPTPDASSGLNISATDGKVALVSNQTALSTGCSSTASGIVDFVGYGSVSCFEGLGAAPSPSNTVSIHRKSPVADTDNNSTDFATGTPTPQNTSSPTAITLASFSASSASMPYVDWPLAALAAVMALGVGLAMRRRAQVA